MSHPAHDAQTQREAAACRLARSQGKGNKRVSISALN